MKSDRLLKYYQLALVLSNLHCFVSYVMSICNMLSKNLHNTLDDLIHLGYVSNLSATPKPGSIMPAKTKISGQIGFLSRSWSTWKWSGARRCDLIQRYMPGARLLPKTPRFVRGRRLQRAKVCHASVGRE